MVFLDHTEVWTFKTGEKATNQFATLHEMKDGKVARWSDYWDVSGFVSQFPQWFLEEMAKSSQGRLRGLKHHEARFHRNLCSPRLGCHLRSLLRQADAADLAKRSLS